MRIVVAMSGGVDSSVAAALLVEQGHDVIGVSMRLYDASDGASADAGSGRAFGSCCSLDDLQDARRVAAALGIPHYVLDLAREFHARVVSNFVQEYVNGRTPLPCAHCNSDLKFSTLAVRAEGFGAEEVATGHYARVAVDPSSGRHLLKRGLDPSKDQAYFLFSLTQAQLAQARFPVGDWSKHEVREHARRLGLPVADKPDSQEICFIPDDDYSAFVEKEAPGAVRDGHIVDEQGQTLGMHAGIHRFTVGQRKGLGLGGARTGSPLYVLHLHPATGEVVVGPRAALERTVLTASGVNWITAPPGPGGRPVTAQIRHRHRAAPASLRQTSDSSAEVVFETPQLAVTPGQAVVFFDEDVVVGGGWIDGAGGPRRPS
jgi:tRNA-specific 2-thiouridylase